MLLIFLSLLQAVVNKPSGPWFFWHSQVNAKRRNQGGAGNIPHCAKVSQETAAFGVEEQAGTSASACKQKPWKMPFSSEWTRKQEDLFVLKWRNTDVATGMKQIEGDGPQTNTAALDQRTLSHQFWSTAPVL